MYHNQEASSLISCNVSSAPSTDKMSQKEKLNPLKRPRFIFTAQRKRVNLEPRGYNSTVGTSFSLLPLIRFLPTDVYICRDEASSASLAPRFHQGVAKSQEEEMSPMKILRFLVYLSCQRPFTDLSKAGLGCSRREDPTRGWNLGNDPQAMERGVLLAPVPTKPPPLSPKPLEVFLLSGPSEAGAGRAWRAARCDWAPGGPPPHPGASGGGGASRLPSSRATGAY